MPIIANTKPATVRAANTLMAQAFFPRAKDWIYPRLSATSVSTSPVEPYVSIGSVPMLRAFNGRLSMKKIPSYTADVPNILFKNGFEIDRSEYEFDQTKVLTRLAPAMGVRVAELPDYLWAKRLLKGSTAGSQTVSFKGRSYTVTMDGKPFFATDHATSDTGTAQSNIVQGTLPATVDGVLAQDVAATANQMVRDLQAVINALRSVKDTAGVPLFPNIDPGKSLVVCVPPTLQIAAQLAFRTTGSFIGGTNGSSSGSTTNIAPQMVKDVICSGLFAGFPDPESQTGDTVSPVNPTDWYVFVDNDFVKPFYVQTYRPPTDDEMFPRGYNPVATVDAILKADSTVTVDQANVYASTIVETTFNQVGSNASRDVIENEAFLVASRFRGNVAYGPWFLGWRVKPNGGT